MTISNGRPWSGARGDGCTGYAKSVSATVTNCIDTDELHDPTRSFICIREARNVEAINWLRKVLHSAWSTDNLLGTNLLEKFGIEAICM